MNVKKFEWRILIRVILLFCTLAVSAYLLVTYRYIYFFLTIPLIIYQVVDFIEFQKKTHKELNQFVEAVHYRDFSRYFNVKQAPAELQPLREGFNEINSTFKVISKEKETQYQYLQKILEMVDTGIVSFHVETGEVVWMNESIKKMLQIPYLKTIHTLAKRDEGLYKEIESLQPGENKIATAHLERGSFKVLLSATAFQTEGQRYKLVAFQNVNEALDETESKAWQKLLSVMTHEIMNSIAPISSLAETMKNRLQSAPKKDGDNSLEDFEIGIDTIKRRSEGLLKFAETYRNLNKITTLNLKKVFISELFANLHQLMQPTFEQKGIELEIILKDPGLSLQADINLLEQVLINLVVNAIEGVRDTKDPKIILSAEQNIHSKTIIKVADNGHGMSDEILNKIFIPFFSTKKQGSGIGLSLCKQIVMLHKGSMHVQSIEGKGTVFLMKFG
jgi:two-component system, NtrC family, nitrogen regulation sensor histidine kinase NtrY